MIINSIKKYQEDKRYNIYSMSILRKRMYKVFESIKKNVKFDL